MSTTVAILRAIIGMDTSGFDSGVRSVQTGSNDAANSMKKLGEALGETGESASGASSSLGESAEAIDKTGQAAAEAEGDVRQLANAADKATQEVKELGSEADKADDKIDKAGNAADKTSKKTKNLGDEAKDASKKVRELAANLSTVSSFVQGVGASLTAGLTLPIIAIGAASVDAATDLDSLVRGLSAVAGSSEETEFQMRRLREVAKLPGLGFEDAIKGATNLQAAGFSASMAERSLKAFGNALATVGKGKADLDGVNIALTQLANRTSGFGQEIRQLQERLPQIRQVMLKAFGTADSEQIGKMGITGKQFVELVTREFEKLPSVLGGAKNAFENFADSMRISLAELGDSILPVVTPGLQALGSTAEYTARIFGQLPAPIRGTILLFTAAVAAIGPLVLAVGTLGLAVSNMSGAWQAWLKLKVGISAALALQTVEVTTLTGAITANAVAINSWSAAAKLAVPVIGSLIAGWTLGTMVNDQFIGSFERATQATEDATRAQMRSIPFLEETFQARKKLAQLEDIITRSGNTAARTSPRYQEAKKNVQELEKQYQEAANLMAQGFDRAAAEAATSVEKMRAKFAEALMESQKELDKLKAPTLEAKLKIDYPKVSEEEIRRLAAIEREIEANKKLAEARKKAAEDHARSVKNFREQVEEARRELNALRAPNTAARIRALNPGMPEGTVRELAGLKDQITAMEKVRDKREEEKKKIEELSKALSGLGMSAGAATKAVQKTAGLQPARIGTTVPGSPSIPIKPPPGVPVSGSGRAPGEWGGSDRRLSGMHSMSYTGPALPMVGAVENYKSAVDKLAPSLKAVAAVQTQVTSTAGSLAQQLSKDIGVEQAQKLAESTKSLRAELAQLNAETTRDKVAAELTGKAYDKLSAATKNVVDENVRLKQGIAGKQELKTLGEAWNSVRLEMLRSQAATEEERIALDTLKKSFGSLSPEMQGRIVEMAAWKKGLEETKRAAEEAKKFNEELGNALSDSRQKYAEATAATNTQRITLELFRDKLKAAPATVRNAADAIDYLRTKFPGLTAQVEVVANAIEDMNASMKKTDEAKKFADSIEQAVGDARLKFLQAKAATEEERVAIGLLGEHVGRLPAFVETAGSALLWFKNVLGLNVDEAVRAADAIAKFSKAMEKPKESAPDWMKDYIKWVENVKKASADFFTEMQNGFNSATRAINGLTVIDPAAAAWLDYLEQNKALAEGIKYGYIDAKAARDAFIKTFDAKKQAETVDKLRDAYREASFELAEAKGQVSEFDRVMHELGITADRVDASMRKMIDDIVKMRKEAKRVKELKEQWKRFAEDTQAIFEDAFETLFEKGFKSFFDSVIAGFQQMLARMAAEFLASQLMKLVTNLIGNAFAAGAGGGGGGNNPGMGDYVDDGTRFAANGGPVVAGKPYIVGERGPELFVPSGIGSIVPNHDLGNGQTVINFSPTYNINTPNPEQFRRSQSQLITDGARQLRSIQRRNGG